MGEPMTIVDLDYQDPPAPADLAARARRQGVRLRRRRRALQALPAVAAIAVAAAVLFAGGLVGSTGSPTQAGGGELSASQGQGPLATSIVGPATTGLGDVWGSPRVISRQQDNDGRYPVLYVSTSAQLCIGHANADGTRTTPSTCQPIGRLPEAGFAAGGVFSGEGNLPAGVDAHLLVTGLVRGDVTKVVISTPRGDVAATLAPAKDPSLGQLYWAETPVVAGPSSTGDEHFIRTAYRGAEAVFSCDETSCARPPETQGAPPGAAPASVSDATAELNAYLDAWRAEGPAVSSRAYLTPDQQVTNDADAPRLKTGRVTDVSLAQATPEGQMFYVTLELSFEGEPIAWNEGTNERFVTFAWRGGDIPYAMTFATGP